LKSIKKRKKKAILYFKFDLVYTMSTASANTSTINQIYSEAKKALNASMPDRVVCRLDESRELEKYLLSCFKEKKTLSLYVNGQPGTGKTLSCMHLLDNLKVHIWLLHFDI
jgi:Cdc6-like AAA superfamily ATPase